MATVPPFHTDHPEYNHKPPNQRDDVYHDQSECQFGQAIKPEHRIEGSGGRDLCSRCEELASLSS